MLRPCCVRKDRQSPVVAKLLYNLADMRMYGYFWMQVASVLIYMKKLLILLLSSKNYSNSFCLQTDCKGFS